MNGAPLASRLRGLIPTRESLEANRFLRPVAHRVLAPALWRFNRRSVPRGVALGLFVGIVFMLPGAQMAGAALLALPIRANVPVAVGGTLLSNPLTTPLILLAALWTGNHLLGLHADMSALAALKASEASIAAYARWFFSDAAPALLAGLVLIGAVTATLGYALTGVLWRWWMARAWRRRPGARAKRG